MKLFLYLTIVLLFLPCGCNTFHPRIPGSGISQTEHRLVDAFDEINLAGFGTVNVLPGQQQSVLITTDDNLLSCIETTVENGKLKIDTKGNIQPRAGLVIDVTMPELAAAKVSGAGELNVDGVLGQQLDLSISGAGDVKASGQVRNVSTKISGAGSADLQQLVTETSEVKISGAGHADVFATESVSARVSGAGSVNCYGNPADVRRHVSGAGKVRLR